jgi:hypothetical protein
MQIEAVAAFACAGRTGDVPLYVSAGDYFIYGVFVPEHLLVGDFIADILAWNMNVPRGIGYSVSFGSDGANPSLCDPIDHSCSSIIDKATPTLFLRHLAGRPPYVEPNQLLTHILDLHQSQEKGTWSSLNKLGELVPLLRSEMHEGFVCTLDREALDTFLVVSNTCLVRVIDVTRRDRDDPCADAGPPFSDPTREVFFTPHAVGGDLRYLRGFDIVRPSAETRKRVHLKLQGREPREYASFKIQDWKHRRVVEWTTDPERIGNYFVASDLPFGISPVFFKPEILTQYRVDPSRYKVLPDCVTCIGAWSLPYYVNEEGQVHVYLIDLARLPFEEQLRWKTFNQEPRGPLAQRAITQDFKAEFSEDYDPLLSLLEILEDFPAEDSSGNPCAVWALGTLPETRNLDFLGYVVTDSRKELEDQISALVQIVIEGLSRGEINRLADGLGCRDDKQLGSLKQLGKVLDALGIPVETRDLVLVPLIELYGHRSRSVAHRGTGSIAADQKKYFRDTLERCDKAMRTLAELVRAGTFTQPPPAVPSSSASSTAAPSPSGRSTKKV